MAIPPLLIRDKGESLTCEEYDENVLRGLERGNHKGTQTCNTISDLEDCVLNYTFIRDLQNNVEILKDELNRLEEDLFGQGELSELLAALRFDLEALVREVGADVSTLKNLTNTLQARVVGVERNLEALTDLIEFHKTLSDNKFGGIENNLTRISLALDNVLILIGQLRTDLNNEITNRINGDNNLQNAINAEVVIRRTTDESLQTQIDVVRDRAEHDIPTLLELINSKAPKTSPIFLGNPANLSGGAIVPAPPNNAVGNEVINAAWYHAFTALHLNNIVNALNTKASINSPSFTGESNFNGLANFHLGANLHAGGVVKTPELAANDTQIINSSWARHHIDKIDIGLHQTNLAVATLDNNVSNLSTVVHGIHSPVINRFNIFEVNTNTNFSNIDSALAAVNADILNTNSTVNTHVNGLNALITTTNTHFTNEIATTNNVFNNHVNNLTNSINANVANLNNSINTVNTLVNTKAPVNAPTFTNGAVFNGGASGQPNNVVFHAYTHFAIGAAVAIDTPAGGAEVTNAAWVRARINEAITPGVITPNRVLGSVTIYFGVASGSNPIVRASYNLTGFSVYAAAGGATGIFLHFDASVNIRAGNDPSDSTHSINKTVLISTQKHGSVSSATDSAVIPTIRPGSATANTLELNFAAAHYLNVVILQ